VSPAGSFCLLALICLSLCALQGVSVPRSSLLFHFLTRPPLCALQGVSAPPFLASFLCSNSSVSLCFPGSELFTPSLPFRALTCPYLCVLQFVCALRSLAFFQCPHCPFICTLRQVSALLRLASFPCPDLYLALYPSECECPALALFLSIS
jgi:hypothetical protein